MKTSLIHSVIIVITILMTTNVSAQTSFRPKVYSTTTETFQVQLEQDSSDEKFVMIISNPRHERLHIRLTSASASFEDATIQSEYRKRISLAAAEDGKYLLTVSNNKRTIAREILLKTTTQVIRKIELN